MQRIPPTLIALSLLLIAAEAPAAQAHQEDAPRREASGRRDVAPARGGNGGQAGSQGQRQDPPKKETPKPETKGQGEKKDEGKETDADAKKRTPPIRAQERRDVQRIDARGQGQGQERPNRDDAQGRATPAGEAKPGGAAKEGERRDVAGGVRAQPVTGGDAPKEGQTPKKGPKVDPKGEVPAKETRDKDAPARRIDRGQAQALLKEMTHHRERLAKIDKLVTVFEAKKDDPAMAAKLERAQELRKKENNRHEAALAKFRERMGEAEFDAVRKRIQQRKNR